MKTKPFSGFIKSIIISTTTFIFGILISIISILVYKACYGNQIYINSTNSESPISMYQTANEEYKYNINTRNLEESYFQSPIENSSIRVHSHDNK